MKNDILLRHKRDTKNKHVFVETDHKGNEIKGNDATIQTLYVNRKLFDGRKCPKYLSVKIREEE